MTIFVSGRNMYSKINKPKNHNKSDNLRKIKIKNITETTKG